MISLQQISYIHPNKDLLFENISLTINSQEKIALIGNNGVGKSTLLRLIAGELAPATGSIHRDTRPFYVPQITGQYDDLTIAEALGIDKKLDAFYAILEGDATEGNFNILQDDWTLEERCQEAFRYWNLPEIHLTGKMSDLSGGQKAKVLLAGIQIHGCELILLDEPSNHLDMDSKKLLYQWLQASKQTVVIVSHDRTLLNLLEDTLEMTPRGIKRYGGNYAFYESQKEIERNALEQDIHYQEKAIKIAKEKERETIERQNRLNNRGQKKQEKAGVARIMMNTLRNNAEKSTAKIKSVHQDKIGDMRSNLQDLRSTKASLDEMKIDLGDSTFPRGKSMIKATKINFSYNTTEIWPENIDLQLFSGERIILQGKNGSGKTTLIKILLGHLSPSQGQIERQRFNAIYLDQEYSLIDLHLSVYEQAQSYNSESLAEHDIKIRLNRFLFGKDDWDKPCRLLSGGEKMRLILCCLTIRQQAPDLIVLDEPTNNLDIQNIRILTRAIQHYKGTLLVISHDEMFQNDIGIDRAISLKN
ncbi:ABC transporter ATP-binding protein [Sphingobacterium sp. CZ-UAM]|uniref:ABC-F family ATP-binding cassette domain-containing protein n=1 Tax=Sphingobacterium sp. CZ-UAM TaxID=1933868 RepID=UPI0009841473|nr:ABC-F family ATP-binding cassette domain-containing protein [Sphingobacterium sp. CZ-UAM]OOG18500.1 ABC transporter ATP-binding protein [Sphingobacterium sp. CZ-UAM]